MMKAHMTSLIRYGLTLLIALSAGRALALGGDFTLTDSSGAPYHLSDSRGQVVILAFGYTFCPDVCPTALATIAQAMRQLGTAADRVDPLFVTLDPDRDTPAHLQEYTRFFHPRLRGLTGDADTLDEVARRYRVHYNFVGKGEREHYSLDHSANVFILDTRGKLYAIVPHGLPPEVFVRRVQAALQRAEVADAVR